MKDCPRCLDPIVLNGSRHTNKGWKVSYHLVYPLLAFPCNNTVLKAEVTALSNLPHLQIRLADGTCHHFVDTAVYSRNQLFRLPLNFKLSDDTCTSLSLPGDGSLSEFRTACVTCVEAGAWRIPNEGGHIASASRALRIPKSHAEGEVPQSRSTADPDIVKSLKALLRKSGQPEGRLIMMHGTVEAATFRWDASPRPC